MKNAENIKGIPVEQIINLLNQFADDLDVMSENDENSVRQIMKEINDFERNSGFKISYDKTTMYRIGSLKKSNAKIYTQPDLNWSSETIKVLGINIFHDPELQISKNFEPLITKSQGILNQWSNRSLSLIGKINVINVLIGSLFVYKMLVLPNLTNKMVKKIQQIFTDFIWNFRRPKIALKILQARKTEGGLGLVNITARQKALKSSWIQILQRNRGYAKMVYSIIDVPEWVWRCTIHPKDVCKIVKNNIFWQQFLEAWATYAYKEEVSEISTQILWYNSKILISNEMIYWKKCEEKGLMYVNQLYQQCKAISLRQAMDMYGLLPLQYNSLMSAIPREWKNFFKTQEPTEYMPIVPSCYDKVKNHANITKVVYSRLIVDNDVLNNKKNKWETELNVIWSNNEFVKKIRRNMFLTNVPKLRSFQYRIMQRAIVTNVLLKKWNIIDTDTCTFCHQYTESVRHMFYECSIVQTLWNDIWEIVETRYKVQVDSGIEYSKVMFNEFTESRTIANFIGLLAKQYIYRCRCEKKIPSVNHFVTIMNQNENIEKYIAVKNHRLPQHLKKWNKNKDK